jgi:hypothetical protein
LTRIVQPYSWEIATRELCADAGFPAIGVVLRSWAALRAKRLVQENARRKCGRTAGLLFPACI